METLAFCEGVKIEFRLCDFLVSFLALSSFKDIFSLNTVLPLNFVEFFALGDWHRA